MRRPLRSSSRGTAKTGPMPISSGSQPATARPRNTPIGSRPRRAASALRHEDAGRGAVGKLARIAGGDECAVAAHRFQLGEALARGIGAVALVLRQRHGLAMGRAGLLVGDELDGLERHDLAVEPSLALRRRDALLALVSAYSSWRSRLMP